MATDLYHDNPSSTTPTSPRISFSYDLSQSDTVPVEHLLRTCSSSSVDFNFFVHENSDPHQASLADELFLDGKILPTPMRSKTEKYKPTPLPYSSQPRPVSVSLDAVEELNKQNTKSFWGFKRSSSCGSGYAKSLCPIVLLSRSHSMGSSTSSKQTSSSSREVCDKKYQRNVQKCSVSQKPPLRKTGYGYGSHANVGTSNGIRVNPVINFGFGSFFFGNSKIKNKK